MSKIGKINIAIPEKVKVVLSGSVLNMDGPLGKKSLNIDGFGEKQAKQLYDLKIISNIADIFSLEKNKNIIKKLEGWGSLSFTNLVVNRCKLIIVFVKVDI